MTAMCTPCGTVQWTVKPIGLNNAQSMLQKGMQNVLVQTDEALDLKEFSSIYIADLLIATRL